MAKRVSASAAEHVVAVRHPADDAQHIPRINTGGTGSGTGTGENDGGVRPFRPDDMPRVLDYEGMPPPPEDCVMLHGESDSNNNSNSNNLPEFPERVVVLRGSYLFYYDPDDVDDDDDGTNAHSDDKYVGPPLGVVPLDRVVVEFPPGGRRVFREHAPTDARNGYEMLVRHRGEAGGGNGNDDDGEDSDDSEEDVLSGFRRPGGASGGGAGGAAGSSKAKNCRAPHYLVASSLGEREEWAAAIRVRAEAARGRLTRLRPAKNRSVASTAASTAQRSRVSSAERSAAAAKAGGPNPFDGDGGHSDDEEDEGEPGAISSPERRRGGAVAVANGRDGSARQSSSASASNRKRDGSAKAGASGAGGAGGGIKIPGRPGTFDAAALGVAPEEQADVNSALRQFGQSRFDEAAWVEDFFKRHNEFDAPGMVRKLEKWQGSMKKGLRGAVLEQYEYFVEASKEMTTMGREVATLRQLVDAQLETVQGMRTIDFAAAFADPVADDYSYYSGDDMMGMDDMSAGGSSMGSSVEGALGGGGGAGKHRRRGSQASTDEGPDDEDEEDEGSFMEIPSWLDDATEEVSAFLKECRYTDATDLIVRARTEVNDVLAQHERLTDKRLGKKQLSSMQRILHDLDGLSERLGNRLAEGLRRKNEALKQTIKRERADPLSVLAPLVSPVCLNDDAVALHLLVKLGRSNDAATAYSARRSLLLMECLHERPIASANVAGTMDVVIYAAQLSQSFFSCLSQSVEGFLDLFLTDSSGKSKGDSSNNTSFDEMSSIRSSAAINKVPAGAIAAVVLWCDSELSKFAAAFGGTRVLGNLALSPPVHGGGGDNALGDKESIADLRKKLRDAEDAGDYSAAAKLRSKLSEIEQDGKGGRSKSGGSKPNAKEREEAIDISAKCVDQAFQFASENLDSIGLPMTPRLAEYIRARLKGCEGEIAQQLQSRWGHVTFDWSDEGGAIDIEAEDAAHLRDD